MVEQTSKTSRMEFIHHFRVALLLASLLLQEVSSSNPYASTSTFFPPIRIGVSTSSSAASSPSSSSNVYYPNPSLLSRGGSLRPTTRRPKRFPSSLLAFATEKFRPQGASAAVPGAQWAAAATANQNDPTEEIYDDEEWKALFENDYKTGSSGSNHNNNNNDFYSVTYAASRKSGNMPCRNEYEAMKSGFHRSLTLPALMSREEEIAFDDLEEAAVVPCAAVAVSSKTTASFSSMSSPAREATMNQRKESKKEQRQQQQSSTAPLSLSFKKAAPGRPLVFWENMICGAVSRSVAQTIMHPANTMKTLLQQSNAPPMSSYLKQPVQQLPVLFRGAGANFILSVPHGAINFAVLELVRKQMAQRVRRIQYLADREDKLGPAMDFMSSAISTICCSVVSTPQMMITDNIMAGNFQNLPEAVKGLASQGKGLSGFYARGWWPGLVGKIPSYALTWTFFQQLKEAQKRFSGREATNAENTIMGCVASGTCVCIMIPMDTIKTRLVTQANRAVGAVQYKGIVDCAMRIAKEEGVGAFYRGLPPRLVSVVPMIGIQFTVYEFMKRLMQKRALEAKAEQQAAQHQEALKLLMRGKKDKEDAFEDPYGSLQILQEASMEVAASPEHPYPAPHFLKIMRKKSKGGKSKKNQ